MPQQDQLKTISWDEIGDIQPAGAAPAAGVSKDAAAAEIRKQSLAQGNIAETWLKDKFVGGAKRRLGQLAAMPGQVIEAFRQDPAKAVVDIGEGVLTAPFQTIKNVVTDPVGTFKEDPLQILEALSLASGAKRGIDKLAATHVKPLTKERLQARSATATTQALSPKQIWRTNNQRMREQEAGYEHIPANAMPGFRLQKMADRMDPVPQSGISNFLGLRPTPTRPALTDEFLQKLEDQVIAPAETRASALVAADKRGITASDFLRGAKRTQKAKIDDTLVAPLVPEPSSAIDDAIANFRTRSPHGTLYDATPGMPDVEVLDPLVTPRSTVGRQRALVNGNGLPVGQAIGPASYVDDVADAEAAFTPPSQPRNPDLDATPVTVELPMPASQMDAMKKAVNKYGASKFGKDVTDAQFYARDKIRGDIKDWLEQGSGGNTARSTLELPKNFDDLNLKEANLLEGDALALKRLVTDKFQQLGSAPVDNSYRLARIASSPLQPWAPQARTAIIGMGLDTPAAKLAKGNIMWNLANKSGNARNQQWFGDVLTNRRLAALLGSEADQATERADPWAQLFSR